MKAILIIVFILALIFGIGALFLYGFETIANFVPVPVSLAFFVFGVVCYVTGLIMLRKSKVYHVDSPDQIRLDTPLFADYAYIFGVICMVVGVATFQPLMSSFSDAWILFSLLSLFAVYKLVVMVMRLKHAIHDKIVVCRDNIQLDKVFPVFAKYSMRSPLISITPGAFLTVSGSSKLVPSTKTILVLFQRKSVDKAVLLDKFNLL